MGSRKVGAWRKDKTQPGQHEDYRFEEAISKLKILRQSGDVDLRRYCSEVEDQGEIGGCVGNAVVGALELIENRDGHPYVELSRMFIYYNSRLMHNDQNNDSGTYIRIAMGTLSSLGTCAETKWPYDPSKYNVRPTWGSYREAYAHKINSYYRIFAEGSQRTEQIKQALRSEHPVVFGMTIDESYFYVGRNGVVKMPDKRDFIGGHAQLIVGFNDARRVFIVRNSWGTSWGDNGYAYVPYDYLDAGEADDVWVPTSVKVV